MQRTGTSKSLAFFLRFKTKERAVRVNKSKIGGENTFIENNFRIEANHGLSKEQKVLKELFAFCYFLANSCCFRKLVVNSLSSTLNFQ